MQNAAVKGVFLEAVWSTLSEQQWQSAKQIEAASGVDERTLKRVVDFLVRWDFAEARPFPTLHVKRKAGALSPVDVVGVLRAVAPQAVTTPKRGRRLAERVSCRLCGNLNLKFLGENEVECTKCHERQWFAIDIPERVNGSVKPRSKPPVAC
jgi:hypothetical protein